MTPPIRRTVRLRECAREGCPERYDVRWREEDAHWPIRFCGPLCALKDAQARAEAKAAEKPGPVPKPSRPRSQLHRTATPAKRRPIGEASPEQREAIRTQSCLVDASHEGRSHPAHLIPRGMLTEGQEDARAVVPLCPACHRAYDDGSLSLLEHLEPRFRVELAFAVERFGLLSTLRRVTNDRRYMDTEAA